MDFEISARVRQSWLQTHCEHALSFWANHCAKILCFCVHSAWGFGPYISRKFLIWTHFVNASWKNIGPSHAHFQYNARKLVSLKTVLLFTLRKLSNEVITTACKFWRQIACSFLGYGTFYSQAKPYLKCRQWSTAPIREREKMRKNRGRGKACEIWFQKVIPPTLSASNQTLVSGVKSCQSSNGRQTAIFTELFFLKNLCIQEKKSLIIFVFAN